MLNTVSFWQFKPQMWWKFFMVWKIWLVKSVAYLETENLSIASQHQFQFAETFYQIIWSNFLILKETSFGLISFHILCWNLPLDRDQDDGWTSEPTYWLGLHKVYLKIRSANCYLKNVARNEMLSFETRSRKTGFCFYF